MSRKEYTTSARIPSMMYKGIIGAVIGDIAGSAHEFSAVSSPRFKLLQSGCTFTDDTALTMAVADWLLHRDALSVEKALLKWGRKYPYAGYGKGFKAFIREGRPVISGSTHNGSAMRVSPVAWVAGSLDETLELARESALPSHNSPEAITGARAIAAATFLARTGSSKDEIKAFCEEQLGLDLSRSYDEVREEVQAMLAVRRENPLARARLLCAKDTAQDALTAFLVSENYEQTLRKAIWLGGDSDTVACMAGAVAAAFWGVPEEIVKDALVYLPPDMIDIINAIDGSNLKPTGITPPKTSRWSPSDYVVYGISEDGTEGEQGYYFVKPSRFNRHPNTGWPICTLPALLEDIGYEVDKMLDYASQHPENRFLVMELGIQKGGWQVSNIAPMFIGALDMPNVLLPRSFRDYLLNR